MSSYFYILRLKSGQLYIGSTRDVDQRYKDHQSGKGCRTTRLDPPKALLYTEEFNTLTKAQKRENQVKKWTRAKKEMLAAGDPSKLQHWKRRS